MVDPLLVPYFLVQMHNTSASLVRERTENRLGVFSFCVCCDSFLLLVVRPGAPSSVLAPSSKARSP